MVLNEDKSITLTSDISIGKTAESVKVEMTASIDIEDRRKLQFVNVSYKGCDRGQKLGQALIDHVNNLLDLDKFALEGMQVRVDRLRIRGKKLVFYGTAKIDQFPQRKTKTL
jgi:hypothetical protein